MTNDEWGWVWGLGTGEKEKAELPFSFVIRHSEIRHFA
jgi:hypothetical protein